MPPATEFLIVYLSLLTLHFAIERALSFINGNYVRARCQTTPEALKGVLAEDKFRKSIEYTLVRERFGHISAAVGLVLTLIYLFSGFLPWLHHQAAQSGLSETATIVAFILTFMLVHMILNLPLSLYHTFKIEAKFGFNKTTAKLFWLDTLKSILLSIIIGVPFGYGVVSLMLGAGPLWWLWASLFVIFFQAPMMVLFPMIIAPLFNKSTPLSDGELKKQLEDLAQKCNFTAHGIFVMDGSKRSAHSNAYFTGIGKAKRIVLFDTLIEQMRVNELVAVLAHEIGHYKKKHILKFLILSSALTMIGFFILSKVLYWLPLYQAFGIDHVEIGLGILIFSLIAGDFVFWISPLMHALSRKHEYEADQYAAENTGEANSLKTALLKLYEKNLSNPIPHPAYSAYHYTHPTLLERLDALSRFKPDRKI